ncbi:hypothetical protein [Dokdonella sp.]|uniref:hypothetical protein n=1 Tax=Dokdonella sp. TaxID=2291710 RepID=UPI003C486810
MSSTFTAQPARDSGSGPWPFITRRIHHGADGALHVVHSRAWRKAHFGEALNRPIGVLFALGSLLFAAGSVLSLWPALARAGSLNSLAVNAVFFSGSIPFTLAAALQWFQAASATPFGTSELEAPRRRIGDWLRDIGWLSCALQFAGTLLFNLNTFDAMHTPGNWLAQDIFVWTPNLLGSILFLASGYLAFVETCHAHGAWRPHELVWWLTAANLLGCIAFMVSAIFAFVPPHASTMPLASIALSFTLLGAIGFLIGSCLLYREAVS